MAYCKDYCEEKGISTSKLNEAQRTLYYIAEVLKMETSISEEGYKHFQMAIKSLEQEPILDKIRAEINSPNRETCDYFIVDRIEEIIDKYKAGEN